MLVPHPAEPVMSVYSFSNRLRIWVPHKCLIQTSKRQVKLVRKLSDFVVHELEAPKTTDYVTAFNSDGEWGETSE